VKHWGTLTKSDSELKSLISVHHRDLLTRSGRTADADPTAPR
jgi:hypothetical protein